MSKKTINVVVRFSDDEFALAEQKRQQIADEIQSRLPGIKFSMSDMIRSMAIARGPVQSKQRATSHANAMRRRLA